MTNGTYKKKQMTFLKYRIAHTLLTQKNIQIIAISKALIFNNNLYKIPIKMYNS